MKSNLKESLFLIFGLLFFLCLVTKEFNQSWLPESFRNTLLENSINNHNERLERLVQHIQRNGFRPISSFEEESQYPLFIYKDGKLVYWNSNESRLINPMTLKEGWNILDIGSEISLVYSRVQEEYQIIGINNLWRNKGIDNKWIQNGSNQKFPFQWDLSLSNTDCNAIEIDSLEKSIYICYIEDNEAKDSSFLSFILMILWLLLLLLLSSISRNAFKTLSFEFRKKIALSFLICFLLLIAYEFYRRFAGTEAEEGVFYIVYPFILSFLVSGILYSLNFKEYDFHNSVLARFGSVFLVISIYLFAKSYWNEVYDKAHLDLSLISLIRLEWHTLQAYLGIIGMALFSYLSITLLFKFLYFTNSTKNYRDLILFTLFISIPLFLIEYAINAEIYFGYFLIVLLLITSSFNSLRAYFSRPVKGLIFYGLCILVLSFLISESSFWGGQKREVKLISEYASKGWQIQEERAVKLLKETSSGIAEDKLTLLAFKDPLVSLDIVKQKIKRLYLDSYFDPFVINVEFFDKEGSNLDPQLSYQNLYYYTSLFLLEENRIDENIYQYRSNELDDLHYFELIELHNSNGLLGSILIEAHKDASSPNSIFPNLLVDEQYQNLDKKDYELVSNSNLPEELESINENDEDIRIFWIGQDLYAKRLETPNHTFRKSFDSQSGRFSEYSIIFLLLSILAIFSYFIDNIGKAFEFREWPLRNKIQFFMNTAFLLPLIIVSIAVLTLMNENDRENVESSYEEKARIIANEIQIPFLDFQNGIIPKRVLTERLSEAASRYSLDYNIYNNSGILENSSKSIIYERGIANRLMDFKAFDYQNNNDEKEVISEIAIGNFLYKAAYAPLFDLNNKQIGILGVPFFSSNEDLENRFIRLLSTVINIFVFTFLVFLLFSERLTRLLMVPVLNLAEKIKVTSFQNENEPLEWTTNDEIGVLVLSYNNMIQKLNESRRLLAITEKEAAWKEMAQQVAHEIKNPLTPMKLRLQQLIKTEKDNPNSKHLVSTMESLLHQVENLSEIATSFSEFARMPNPNNEIIELREILELNVETFREKGQISLNWELDEQNVNINADKNMLSRSIGNIILNGIQSVNINRQAEITISVSDNEKDLLIEINDNGEGIEEETKDKIFRPHFSTKSSGTGIGLALAKKAVEGAGGTISFESEIGKGSSFIITLPKI